MRGGIAGRENGRIIFTRLAHGHLVAGLDLERGNVDLAAIHLDMAVAHDLARLGAAGAETHAVNDIIEPAFEPHEEVLAGDAFLVRGLFEPVAKLRFEQSVDAAELLFFAELEAVADQLRLAILAMLSGNEIALFDSALLAVTALTFEKQLHALAPA